MCAAAMPRASIGDWRMAHTLAAALAAALSVLIAIPLGLLLGLTMMRRIRQSRRFRVGAALTAALFSFATYQDPRERACVEETECETRRKKEKGFGDPPDPDS
jgi:hypothetical protein